ncbi:uncharacterized protein LOC127880910 isoform X2 [Dreissena polymorpha]|uniref:CUB domain-containing protein n=1 Tax=Dreissena polymorpha TaxID=45954 RepID=A0A9D4H6L2_DREPO|nr:uncharacterized protein LOC127880910 isoform X2 [Dreissena polymorpha]KAH3827894.1 hypothetical protein DPMN_129840 [Dreissena polymorpha]
MKSYYTVSVWIWILVKFGLTDCTGTNPQHGYLTHFYFNRKPISVNDSIVLELTNRFLPDTPEEHYLTCDVNVITSPDRKLMVHFISLEISDAEKEIDRLHIFDFKESGPIRITPPQGLFGLYNIYYQGHSKGLQDYASTANQLKIDYQGKPTLVYDGFKILITSFREARGDCGRGFTKCARRPICIPVSTWCDGYGNCGQGDQSDEENCSHAQASTWNPLDGSVTAVVAASVSIATLIIVAAVVLLIIRRANRRIIIRGNNHAVLFRKNKKGGKHRASGQTTNLHAPPSYERVYGIDEAPPSYRSVVEQYTDSEDEQVESPGNVYESSALASATVVDEGNVGLADGKSGTSERNAKQVLVVCDVEGRHDYRTELVSSAQCTPQSDDFQTLSGYKLCSNGDAKHGAHHINNSESALHDLNEADGLTKSKAFHIDNQEIRNPTEVTNGKDKLLTNGHCNGSSTSTYNRSPSRRDADLIEYIDSDN